MKNVLISIIVLLIVITTPSCNSFVSPSSRTATEVMETALVEAKTSIVGTQAAIPTLAITAAPASASTKMPTTTPTFTGKQIWYGTSDAFFATAKAGQEATRTSANATLESRRAVCSEGYSLWPSPEDVVKRLDIFQSNTDKWTALVCLPTKDYDKPGYTQIINHDGSVIWTISYDTFKLPRGYHFLGASQIDAAQNYLYLDPAYTNYSGWCAECFLGWGHPIYKINLDTGGIVTVLPEMDNDYYVDTSISTDFHYLVYSDTQAVNVIHIQDLLTGQIHVIQLEKNYVIVGGFTWTPDETRLIFAAGIDGWEDGKAGISLFRMNVKSLQLQALLLNDKRNLVPWWNSDSSKLWLDDNILNLGSINVAARHFFSNQWAINVESGGIVMQATPTPKP